MSLVSGWDWALAAGCVAGAAVHVTLGMRALRSTGAVLWRRTRPIAEACEGPVEVEGTIHAREKPLKSYQGAPCVLVNRHLEQRVGRGKNASWHTTHQRRRQVPAELRDASGRCLIDLTDAEVIGVAQRAQAEPEGLRATETVLPDGARVLVLGEARPAGMVPGEGYRDTRPLYELRAGGGQRLLVSTLGHGATLWRTAWPALVTLGAGVLLGFLGVWLAATSALLAALVR